MRQKKNVVAIVLTVMVLISGIIIFNISYNAVFCRINRHICEQYSIVKYVKFKNYCFSSYPGCDFDIYVDPNCTPEQAKDIFEDFVTYFSDELINRLHNEMKGKVFLDVDFTNEETNLRMYYFETDDTENFVHWRMMNEYGEDINYTFDRHINLPITAP